MPPHTADPSRRAAHKTAFAKRLRTNPSEAERRLWSLLRNKRFTTLRFRCQQPIGPYVADFFCASARLVIELDGDQHGSATGIVHDAARTRFLEARGYRILRFPNGDILKTPDLVLETIHRAIFPPREEDRL